MAKTKKFLSRDEILGAPDLPLVEIEVPEWGKGVAVNIRGMTGEERDKFEVEVLNSTGPDQFKNARAKLVSVGLVDADGNRLFAEADIEALGKKNGNVLGRLFDAIKKESGLQDVDIEELLKNFASDLKGDSTSA